MMGLANFADDVPHGLLRSGRVFACCGASRWNLSLSGHKLWRTGKQTTMVARKELGYNAVKLLAENNLPILSKSLRSGSFELCVVSGVRINSGCRTDNAALDERRRQTCPPPSKLFWPLAFLPSPLPALSRKRSSWLSRSWKKSPCPSTDLSVPSGARQRTRQFMANASGGWPC